MKHTHLLLDVDGILAQFFEGALAILNQGAHPQITIEDYAKTGNYDIAAAFGISPHKFWGWIDNGTFWRDLDPTPYAAQLVQSLQAYNLPIYIASSPSANPECVPQKLHWLKEHFGFRGTDCMFGSAKHLMAKEGALLIDDLQANCTKFEAHGGSAVCVPSSWNTPGVDFAMVWEPILEALEK